MHIILCCVVQSAVEGASPERQSPAGESDAILMADWGSETHHARRGAVRIGFLNEHDMVA